MILGVIPARYGSTRFPGKPLLEIHGKSMIQRVYDQCKKTRTLTEVIVATDDERIYKHVRGFGGKGIMTNESHGSGTERMAEVAEAFPDFTHFINIQGDEPFIAPSQIDLLGELMISEPKIEICTLIKPLVGLEKINNPNIVKVVIDNLGDALYFSRSPIPYPRNKEKTIYYKHIGIYGFVRETLLKVPLMKPAISEQTESLEQLRWLANCHKIRTIITDLESISIDTPEDLQGIL